MHAEHISLIPKAFPTYSDAEISSLSNIIWGGTTFCCCINVGRETRCQPVLSSQLFLTRFTHLAGRYGSVVLIQ